MAKLLKGNSQDIINANIQTLKNNGYSHARATKTALCCANRKHDAKAKSVAAKVVKKSKHMPIM